MIKLTIQQVRSRATDNSFQRGQSYYHSGAIFDTARRGDEIEGFCQGSNVRPYHVKVALSDRGIVSASCTCEYDYGGDCKHVVALLLTYVAEPESFVERPDLEDSLADRSKEELIALVRQMVKRDPDLQTLVERPIPNKQQARPLVNTESFRRELRRAMQQVGEWGDTTGVDAVYSVKESADSFAQADDWRSASLIYQVILEEATADQNAYYWHDEEGDLSVALDEVITSLAGCLDHVGEDAAMRAAIFKSVLDVVIWNMDEAERDLGLDALDSILRYVRPKDIPAIRARIETALERQRRSRYGGWGVGVYESFLSDLDALDNVDPEITLQRLREKGVYNVLFEKLLALGRAQEAIAVVREHLKGIGERLVVLPRLVEAGYDDDAIQLARELLYFKQSDDYVSQFHNNQVVEWLLRRYDARGDRQASLALQLERMKAHPQIEFYRQLKGTAQALNQWETLHPTILQQLNTGGQFEVITRVYLDDENWDAAWETLEKVKPSTSSIPGLYREHLDLEVAEASHHARPDRAIPVYLKYVRRAIDQRNRQDYQRAAVYLATLRDLYRRTDAEAKWQELINGIKTEFKKLPALQDELRRARL